LPCSIHGTIPPGIIHGVISPLSFLTHEKLIKSRDKFMFSRFPVTIDGVWIGNEIGLLDTAHGFTLQITVTDILVSLSSPVFG
jgi:hypothetical protein